MKNYISIVFLMVSFLSLFSFRFAYSHSATGETNRTQVGPEFAVIAYDSHKGFRLGTAAIQRMNIQSLEINDLRQSTIPQNAIIWVKGNASVYRIREGWIDRIPTQTTDGIPSKSQFPSSSFVHGDEIVVQGGELLRVIELDLKGDQHDE